MQASSLRYPDMKDIYDILREFRHRRAEPFALATLVRVNGSSYRHPGARMLICQDGRTLGSLSAGCLEEEVATRAHNVLQTGEPAIMSFDTRRRFGCNGKIDIFIERPSEIFFVDLSHNLEARRSCFVVTKFNGVDLGSRIFLGNAVAGVTDPGYNDMLVQQIHPLIRLLICGDGPDNAPIRKLSELLGWQAIEVIDPNLISIDADDWTAAIIKSHNYGRDFTGLQRLLPLNLRYVGLIGPRKRRDQLLNDLLDLGVTINAGFFSPAGLDLGAETPEEIALAIISEIQRVFAGTSGESLRELKQRIHATQLAATEHREFSSRSARINSTA